MKRFPACLLALALVACGEPEVSTTPTTPATPAQPVVPVSPEEALAREVIARHLEVTKWKEKLASASSRHDRGTVKFSGIQGKAETWSKKPDRQLFELDLQGFGKMLSGYDGKTAWMSGQMTGSRLLTGTDLLQTRLESGWDSMRKPAELYESLRVTGKKTYQGKECHELELVAKPLSGMDPETTRAARTSLEYYEVATGLLLGSTGRQDGELASGPFERLYLDYQELGGVLVPGVTKLKQGAVEMELTIESIDFDAVTDEQVQPPLEIRTLVEDEASAPAPSTPPK